MMDELLDLGGECADCLRSLSIRSRREPQTARRTASALLLRRTLRSASRASISTTPLPCSPRGERAQVRGCMVFARVNLTNSYSRTSSGAPLAAQRRALTSTPASGQRAPTCDSRVGVITAATC